MPDKTQKSVYYRKAQFTESMSKTLQQMLSTALGKKMKAWDRLQTIDAAASEHMVISSSSSVNTFLCGRLTSFERGGFQIVFKDDPNATNISLDAIEPPKKDGVAQQYARGILYFCIHGNHVAVVQSTALKATAFEQHLAWLLRDQTNQMTAEQGVALIDEPQKATRDRIKKAHVKSVRLGRPLFNETTTGALDTDSKIHKKSAVSFIADNRFINLFKDMLGDDKNFSKLGLEDAVFNSNLEVWVELRYPTRTRFSSQSEASVKLLDDLSIALRDLDEDHASLQLADGTTVHGSELKISGKLEVEMSKGLISESHLYQEMAGWITQQMKHGNISD